MGVGCHFLLQWIFLTQGLNLDLLHCMQILYCLSHQWDALKESVKLLELRRIKDYSQYFCLSFYII